MPPKRRKIEKTIQLFYKDTKYDLVIFNGTSRAELLSAIRDVLSVDHSSTLRFRDADGKLVAFSSKVPDKFSLHVTCETGQAEGVANPEPARFGWSKISSNSGLVGGVFVHQISECGWYAISTPVVYRPGGVYFVQFEDSMCCTTFGVVPHTQVSIATTHVLHDSTRHLYPGLVCVTQNGIGVPFYVRIELYADNVLMIFHSRLNPETQKRVKINYPIRIAVQGAKHAASVKIASN